MFKSLAILSFLADLIPIILLLIHRKILLNKVFFVLFIWTLVSFLFDLLYINADINQLRVNTFLFIVLETIFVIVIYFLSSTLRKVRLAILGIGLVFIVICVSQYFINGIENFPNWVASFAAVFTIILSFILLYDLYQKNGGLFILQNSYLYIAFAYLIYASGNLFLFTLTEQSPDVFNAPGMWSIYLVSNIIKNGFIVKAIMQQKSDVIKKMI